MQIHGGVGYTSEYGAEKLLRDAWCMPIYEGTSQIQALMAMKDTLGGILKRPQAFVDAPRAGPLARASPRAIRWSGAWPASRSLSLSRAAAPRHAHGRRQAPLASPASPCPGGATRSRKEWDPKRDFALAMLHAERLTRLLADEAIAELLLEQAKAHPERRELLERWLDRAELRGRARCTRRSRRPGSGCSP